MEWKTNFKILIPESVKKVIRPFYYKIHGAPQKIDLDPKWVAVQNKLAESKKIIDLGCGNHPVNGASVAVDCFIEPLHRKYGGGSSINVDAMKQKGIQFIRSKIDVPLPFKDREFDFAYSHHVFEHVDDPRTACTEMIRIAKAGAIITPSIFSELIFGRPYHKWLVMQRNGLLIFFKKRKFEDRPFGNHPDFDSKKSNWAASQDTNPFDILLNDSNWYHGKEGYPRLAKKLRYLWYSHAPVIENIFMWENDFQYEVYEDE